MCLLIATEIVPEERKNVRIPVVIQNHRSLLVFIVTPLFGNVVVAHFIDGFENPLYGGRNGLQEALKGVRLFAQLKVLAKRTDLAKKTKNRVKEAIELPTSAQKIRSSEVLSWEPPSDLKSLESRLKKRTRRFFRSKLVAGKEPHATICTALDLAPLWIA
ncbi:hypothetical protein HDU87_004111 [Geranomyces variabilis]|uniref:Uncharacterized protein n=1 Tax=Geranomyces variabilis TaxID=109894 RepID=A0AAD5XUK7_9FUNG|nr:hypothetical protein HDU87_004111 [Geranomyces variabilis]